MVTIGQLIEVLESVVASGVSRDAELRRVVVAGGIFRITDHAGGLVVENTSARTIGAKPTTLLKPDQK